MNKKTYADICLERAEKATEGPWKLNYVERDKTWPGIYQHKKGLPLDFGIDGEEGIYADNKYDLELMAHSRTDVPELARRLKNLREALKRNCGFSDKFIDELEVPLEEK